MKHPSLISPCKSWQTLLVLAALVMTLGAYKSTSGQITVTEINPNQSTLDASDPDGASGGRVNGLAIDPRNDNVMYAASEWGGI